MLYNYMIVFYFFIREKLSKIQIRVRKEVNKKYWKISVV